MKWFNRLVRSVQAGRPVTPIVTPYVGPIRTASLAAGELAAGLLSRALAGVRVEGPALRAAAVTPSVLDIAARGMTWWGEQVFLLASRGGALELMPAYAQVTVGGPGRDTWMYDLDLPAPAGDYHRRAGADEVAHFQWGIDPRSPWTGVGPFDTAAARIAGLMDRGLTMEAAQPAGSLLPVEFDTPNIYGGVASAAGFREEQTQAVEDAVRALMAPLASGGFSVLPMMALTGKSGNARGVPARVGFDPPQFLVDAYRVCFEVCTAAAGVPRALWAATDGAAARAAQSHYMASVVEPLLVYASGELSRVLEADIVLRPGVGRSPAELRERSTALKHLVEAGVPLEQGLATAGLT